MNEREAYLEKIAVCSCHEGKPCDFEHPVYDCDCEQCSDLEEAHAWPTTD